MKILNADFELTAFRPDQYPSGGLPDVAFAGRSNAGKSSLINYMLNRKNIARVGSTPGLTRGLNFFNVNNKLYFVDLPGYGYASVSKGQKINWGKHINDYLSSREQLQLILLLVDIRHAPTQDDRLMYEWILNSGKPYKIIATKLDKISRSQLKERLDDIRSTLGIDSNIKIIPVSSEKPVRSGKRAWCK